MRREELTQSYQFGGIYTAKWNIYHFRLSSKPRMISFRVS